MPRPIRAIIHRSAIEHNLRCVKSLCAPQFLWAVIKANAYGHSLSAVLPSMAQADGLAVVRLADAIECRHSGWTKPILLLEGFFEPSDLEIVDRYRLRVVLHSDYQIEALLAYQPQAPFEAYLKINTGLNRLGFAPDPMLIRQRYQTLRPALSFLGAMTHLANADHPDAPQTSLALQRFEQAIGDCAFDVAMFSNSAALLNRYQIQVPMPLEYRAGICLYGAETFPNSPIALQPAMTLQGKILAIQTIAAGDQVGYGCLFTATEPMRLAIVAGGYADGYPRVVADGTVAYVQGQPARLVGRVAMDMITLDVTAIAHAQIGDWVTFWGQGGMPVQYVAAQAGTVGYELVTARAQRVPIVVE